MGGAPPNRLAPVYPMSSRPSAGRGRRGRYGREPGRLPPKCLPRLRRQAQVGCQRTPAVRELRTSFIVADRGDDDHVLALLQLTGVATRWASVSWCEFQAHRIPSVPVATRTM